MEVRVVPSALARTSERVSWRGVAYSILRRASNARSRSLDALSRGSTTPRGAQTEDSSDASGKLFIGGVSWQTTEEGLAAYFKQFGELIDVALMKNKHTGQPRGFGFVKYRDSSVVDLVLAQDHLLDGRTVDVKRAVPREKAPLRSGGGGGINTPSGERGSKSHGAEVSNARTLLSSPAPVAASRQRRR